MRGEQPWRTNRSRALRSKPVSAEATLWSELRKRRLGGHKLVRQMSIDRTLSTSSAARGRSFVAVDGGTHTGEELAYDAGCTHHLQRHRGEGDGLGLHDGIHRHLPQVLRAQRTGVVRDAQAFLQRWRGAHQDRTAGRNVRTLLADAACLW